MVYAHDRQERLLRLQRISLLGRLIDYPLIEKKAQFSLKAYALLRHDHEREDLGKMVILKIEDKIKTPLS